LQEKGALKMKPNIYKLVETYKGMCEEIRRELKNGHLLSQSYIEDLADRRMIELKERMEARYKEHYKNIAIYYEKCYAIINDELDSFNRGDKLLDIDVYKFLRKEAEYWETKLKD
jgi:hypothetical protein